MSLLLSWIILSLAMWVTAAILPGFHLKSFGGTFVVAAIFGVLNFFVGWIFYTVFAIATLGIALLLLFITRVIVNAILLSITDAVSDTLKIDSFGWALGGAVMISFLGALGESLVKGIF